MIQIFFWYNITYSTNNIYFNFLIFWNISWTQFLFEHLNNKIMMWLLFLIRYNRIHIHFLFSRVYWPFFALSNRFTWSTVFTHSKAKLLFILTFPPAAWMDLRCFLSVTTIESLNRRKATTLYQLLTCTN